MRIHAIIILGALAAFTAMGAVTGTIVLENGEKLVGTVSWSKRDQEYQMKVKGASVNRGIKETEISEIVIDKPAALDAAIDQVAKGEAAAAIPVLQKVVQEYAHLQWDKVAGRYLAEAYVDADKSRDAEGVCDGIIKGEKSAAYRGELAPVYWKVLLKLNQRSKLVKLLEKAEQGNDRYSRGAALIMRGDIVIHDGNESVDACKKALTDGYLRVVFLYTDEEIAGKLQPEALYKAARCFEKLNRNGPANKMRTELKSTYASSSWAKK